MHPKRLGRALSVSLLTILLLSLPSSAAVRTGTMRATVNGFFEFCEPGLCTWWFSSATSVTDWTTTQQHSEGQTYYEIAPVQQQIDLTDGDEARADGFWPQTLWTTTVLDRAGNTVRQVHPAGQYCWASAWPGNDITWGGCYRTLMSIQTATYPPGTAKSWFDIYDSGSSGVFTTTYSGSLR
jgi:hypothetical protein